MKYEVIENQWDDLPKEISVRFKNAIRSIYFFGFLFVLLTIGALGVWIPPARFDTICYLNSESLFTYSGPILAMLLVEYFVQATRSKLAIVALILGLVSFGLLIKGYADAPNSVSAFTIIGTLITLSLIIFVNANNKKFDDDELTDEDINSATGPTNVSVDAIKDR